MTDIAEMLKDIEDERNRYRHNEKAYHFIKKKQLAEVYDARHEVVQEYQFYADYTSGLLPPNYPVPAVILEVTYDVNAIYIDDLEIAKASDYNLGLVFAAFKDHPNNCCCEECRFWGA